MSYPHTAETEIVMADFIVKDPTELSENVFSQIGKRWMLLTAYDSAHGRVNAMTASWGGMGILWNRPVLFVFVRPQRYTYGLLNDAETCSACFLEDGHREALQICGTKSGRDTDKIAESKLNPIALDGVWGFGEAAHVMKLRKLFVTDMTKEQFLDPELLKNYPAEDYHRIYVYEIETVYEKQN